MCLLFVAPGIWLAVDCNLELAAATALNTRLDMGVYVQATYDKLLAEVPKYKLITPSVLSDRLRVRARAWTQLLLLYPCLCQPARAPSLPPTLHYAGACSFVS